MSLRNEKGSDWSVVSLRLTPSVRLPGAHQRRNRAATLCHWDVITVIHVVMMRRRKRMCLGVPGWVMICVDVSLQARESCLHCRRKTRTGGTPTWCRLTRFRVITDTSFVILNKGLTEFLLVSQVYSLLLQWRVEWRYSQDWAEWDITDRWTLEHKRVSV